MKSFKQHSNSSLQQTSDVAVTTQRIQMKQMHILAMDVAMKSNNQIEYHNSREQLARLRNVPDGNIPMLDKERMKPNSMNEAKGNIAAASSGTALSSMSGLGRTDGDGNLDYAVPLFYRKGINPRIKMVQRWDTDSEEVKELLKDTPKLKDHLRTVRGVGSKIQTQLANEWNETMAPTMVWMEEWTMRAGDLDINDEPGAQKSQINKIKKEIKKIINDSKKIQVPDDMRDNKKVALFLRDVALNLKDIIAITNKKSDDGGEAQSSELPGHPGRFYPEMPPEAKDPFYWGPDGTPLVPDFEWPQPHKPQLKPWGRPPAWELPPAIVTAPGVKILSYPDGTIVVYIWVEGQGWVIISNSGGGYVAPWSEPDQGDDPSKQDPGMDPGDPDATDPFNPSGEPDVGPHLPWPTKPDQWDDPKYDPYAGVKSMPDGMKGFKGFSKENKLVRKVGKDIAKLIKGGKKSDIDKLSFTSPDLNKTMIKSIVSAIKTGKSIKKGMILLQTTLQDNLGSDYNVKVSTGKRPPLSPAAAAGRQRAGSEGGPSKPPDDEALSGLKDWLNSAGQSTEQGWPGNHPGGYEPLPPDFPGNIPHDDDPTEIEWPEDSGAWWLFVPGIGWVNINCPECNPIYNPELPPDIPDEWNLDTEIGINTDKIGIETIVIDLTREFPPEHAPWIKATFYISPFTGELEIIYTREDRQEYGKWWPGLGDEGEEGGAWEDNPGVSPFDPGGGDRPWGPPSTDPRFAPGGSGWPK